MNKKQKISLVIGIILILGISLYPPYVIKRGHEPRDKKEWYRYGSLWNPPRIEEEDKDYYGSAVFSESTVRIDALCVEYLAIVILTGSMMMVFREPKK